MDERIISSETVDAEEVSFETSLRPQNLSQYIGQDKVKNNLTVFIEAATLRNEALDHVLLYGPPGLGKTTLAMVIAAEMGSQIKTTSGPAIERPGDLATILTSLSQGMFYLLMKSIVYRERLKKFYIRQWKIIVWIL